MTAVGFVGPGAVGEPMVARLLAAGHTVRVHARRPEVRDRLAAAGAEPAAGPADVAAGAEIVLSCLYSDAQIAAVLPGVAAALEPGAVLVSHTTGTPEALRPLRARVVEAPFSGTVEDARAGRLTVLLGGDPAGVDACEPVLRAYASRILRIESALVAKLLNNLLFAGIAQLTLDALRSGADHGLDPLTLAGALHGCSGDNRAVGLVQAGGSAARFAERVQPYLRKDVAAAAGLARSGGPLAAAIAAGPMDLLP